MLRGFYIRAVNLWNDKVILKTTQELLMLNKIVGI